MLLLAATAYATSLGNGFALDDNWFIVENPVVTEGRYAEAFTRPAWPGAIEGRGNYRPLALSSFALEWSLWGDATLGYHVVSVAAHAAVSLLVLALLLRFLPLPAALAGGVFFALHPVHVEAVANVMGRSELYAALGYLAACLLYLDARPASPGGRAARLLGLVSLFLLALAAKEIAVTLPAALIALEAYRRDPAPLRTRLVGETPTYVALCATLGCYVLVRWSVLGDVTGEGAAAGLFTLERGARVLTALTVWPHYLRLLVFPLDLVADYGPDVLAMTRSVTPAVALGAALLLGAVAGAVGLRRGAPVMALGLAWFVVTISPVSNLLVRSDVLLAERTLYLPSVGAALAVGGLAVLVAERAARGLRRLSIALACGVAVLFFARTVDRNPTWADTFTVLSTIAVEHPESWLAHRTRAIGLRRIGELEAAAEAYEAALEIVPDHYQLLVDTGVFYRQLGEARRAEELFLQAIELIPRHPEAYQRLAEQRLLNGEGRAAHVTALAGLERAEDDPGLWAVLSESYVAKGDLEGAARARRAALSRDTASAAGWSRLAELYEAMQRPADAADARRRAEALRGPEEAEE